MAWYSRASWRLIMWLSIEVSLFREDLLEPRLVDDVGLGRLGAKSHDGAVRLRLLEPIHDPLGDRAARVAVDFGQDVGFGAVIERRENEGAAHELAPHVARRGGEGIGH